MGLPARAVQRRHRLRQRAAGVPLDDRQHGQLDDDRLSVVAVRVRRPRLRRWAGSVPLVRHHGHAGLTRGLDAEPTPACAATARVRPALSLTPLCSGPYVLRRVKLSTCTCTCTAAWCRATAPTCPSV